MRERYRAAAGNCDTGHAKANIWQAFQALSELEVKLSQKSRPSG